MNSRFSTAFGASAWLSTLVMLLCGIASPSHAQSRLTSVTWETQGANRVYHVTGESSAAGSLTLQASTTLLPGSWSDVASATAAGSALRFDVTNSLPNDAPYRFFRLASGGGVLPDMIVNTNTTVTGDIYARDLMIGSAATLFAQGDLMITASGKITLNGRIESGGKLVLVSPGGLEVGPEGLIHAGEGDVMIVSSPDLMPTESELTNIVAGDFQIGGPRTRDGGAISSLALRPLDAFGNHTQLPPIVWAQGANKRNLWIYLLGTLDVGQGGMQGAPITYNLPNGADGANKMGDNAVGENGKDGGSVMIQADQINITGPVIFNLGSGGRGGDAVAGPITSAHAIAKGGNGGNTGHFFMASAFLGILHGININAAMTINFGNGGDGGNATATGLAGKDGSPGENGHSAMATGGNGGAGAFPGSAGSLVAGLSFLQVNGQKGGEGGEATATAGNGGNDAMCPGTAGGKGGKATATGGKGGDARTSLAGGTAGALVGGAAGNGGDATATGGDGGNGKSCCDDQKGGDGGSGGDAVTTPGVPGIGDPTKAIGNPGVPFGTAGDGGNGGNGKPPGQAGAMGIGTRVPNGNPGQPGNDCAEVAIILPHDTADVSSSIYKIGANQSGNLQAGFTTLAPGTGYTITSTPFGENTRFESYAGSPESRAYLDAGTVTLSKAGSTLLSAQFFANSGYFALVPSRPDPLYLPGDMLHYAWTGGPEIPAGSADLIAPTPVTILSPAPTPLGETKDVDTSQDVTFAFEGQSPGIVSVVFNGGDGLTSVVSDCDATKPGVYTIPAAALAKLGKGNGSFAITQSAMVHAFAGDRPVTVRAFVTPRQTDGTDYPRAVLAKIH